jgi:release factor glutamine methyltransferase
MVREALARGAALLTEAGVDTPRLDAELLLADALGIDRAQLILRARETVPAGARARYESLLGRRERHEPVAYLLGRRGFRRLWLEVDRRVLIPRPETELLVEFGLELPHGTRVADVGTGSGAVALALKDERPDLSVCGADVDEDALAMARANGQRLGLEVDWRVSDLLEGVAECEAVVANLPYVAVDDPLPPDVRDYEPARALFAEDAGRALIARLVTAAGARSNVRWLALEVGEGQADAVAATVGAAGFTDVARRCDLAGIERVIVGRR